MVKMLNQDFQCKQEIKTKTKEEISPKIKVSEQITALKSTLHKKHESPTKIKEPMDQEKRKSSK